VLLSNNTAAARLGTTVSEFVGTRLYDHFPKEVARKRKKLADRVFATGRAAHLDDVREKRSFEHSVFPVAVERGKVTRVVAFSRDITNRKAVEETLRKSEEKYRTIFENVVEGIFQISPEGCFISMNPAMARIHGFQSPEDMMATVTDVRRQLCTESGNVTRLIETLRKDEAVRDLEMQVYRKDGSVIWTSTSLHAVRDTARNVFYFEGTTVDVTERKEAEDCLKRSHEQLHALTGHLQRVREEERARIAREIHDELGQALTGIKIDLSRLRSNLMQEGSAPAHVFKEFNALLLLVNNTIEASRTLSSRLRPSILDDLGLVTALKWYARRFSERTGIMPVIRCQEEEIQEDPDRAIALFRIYQECLTNITRHARADTIIVDIREEGQTVIMQISDNGIGMPDDQDLNAQSFGIRGMKERAFALGGVVDISSRPGKGTTVRTIIPIIRDKGLS